jgi:hypothetical protein
VAAAGAAPSSATTSRAENAAALRAKEDKTLRWRWRWCSWWGRLRSTAAALLGSRSPSMMSVRARGGGGGGGVSPAARPAGSAHKAPIFCGVAEAGSAENMARKSDAETCRTSGRVALLLSACSRARRTCAFASERSSTTMTRSCSDKLDKGLRGTSTGGRWGGGCVHLRTAGRSVEQQAPACGAEGRLQHRGEHGRAGAALPSSHIRGSFASERDWNGCCS